MAKAVVRDGRVQMLDAQGAAVAVPVDQIQDAYAQGFTVEDPAQLAAREKEAQYNTLGNEALTFGEGFLSDLTFSASDHLLVAALGDEYREGAAARREVNPIAHNVGRAAGAVAPIVASSGGGLAARAVLGPGRALGVAREGAGALFGGSTVGRILGATAAGAVEGAAYDATRLSSENAIENKELTAEKLLSSVAEGALWGSIGDATFTAASLAAGKVLNRMTQGRGLDGAVRDYLDNRIVKGLADDAPIGLAPDRVKALGRRLSERGVPVNDVGAAKAAVAAARAEADDIAVRVAKLADDAGAKPDLAKVFAAADEQAAKLRKVAAPEYQAAAKRIESDLKPLRNALNKGQDLSVSGLQEVRQSLARNAPKEAGVVQDAVTHVRDKIDDAVRETFEKVDDEALHAAVAAGDPTAAALLRDKRNVKDAWLQATADAKDWALLEQLAARKPKPAVQQALGDNTMLGAVVGLATGDVSIGLLPLLMGKSGIKDYIKDRGADTLLRMADRLTRVERSLDDAAEAMIIGSKKRVARNVGVALEYGSNAVYDPNNTGGARGHVVEDIMHRIIAVESGEVAAQVAEQFSEQPEVAMAMNAQLAADAAYLKQRIPAQTPAPDAALRPGQPTGPVSPLAVRELAAIAQALHSPPSVFANIARGQVDMVQVQALRDRRPLLFADMQARVRAAAAASPDPIPFEQRNLIGLVFDFPADWSLDPANAAAIQAAVKPEAGADAPGSTGPSQSANIPAKAADAYALPLSPVNP